MIHGRGHSESENYLLAIVGGKCYVNELNERPVFWHLCATFSLARFTLDAQLG